jgi:WD40 repeat protein
MRCLNCHTNGIPANTQYCTNCGVYLPSLLHNVLQEGTLLKANTYRIEYALGRGGFGITYLASHIDLEQPVAIKEYYPQELAHRHNTNGSLTVPQNKSEIYERWLTRFLREGRILAKLNHPNLVRVQDLFRERGTAYLVMELLSGQTLTQELNSKPEQKLAPQRVTEIMTALVSALAQTHEMGVYHLDLKPDNILLTPEGRLVLIDFGAAKQESGTLKQAQSTRAYTADYAPPELIGNQEIGPESDIFELGMMLHEMLTSLRPPPALSRLMGESWQPQLAQPWQDLVTSALQLQKNERPHTVTDWWQKVENFPNFPNSNSVIDLRGHFILPQLQGQGMVQRFGHGLIQNVTLLNQEIAVVCASYGVMLFNINNGELFWEIDCPTDFSAVSADGRFLALTRHQNIYLWSVVTPTPIVRKLQVFTDLVTSVAFSSDNQILASGSSDNTILLWNTETGEPTQKLEDHQESIVSLAFSPDNQFLASGSFEKIILWDISTGQKLREFPGHAGINWCIAFSPDNRLLTSVSQSNTIYLWEISTGIQSQYLAIARRKPDLTGFPLLNYVDVKSITFSPNGQLLAFGSSDDTVELWEIATDKQPQILGEHTNSVRNVTFSPDGKLLGSGSWDKTVRFWDITTGTQQNSFEVGTNEVTSIAFSPDNQFFAIAREDEDKPLLLWNVMSGEKSPVFLEDICVLSRIAFSPNNQVFAGTSYDSILLWNKTTGKLLKELSDDTETIWSIAFSPDSQLLASGCHDQTIRLWNLATGQQLETFPVFTDEVYSVTFSPDGKVLASGSGDAIVQLWDVNTGQLIRVLEGHISRVNSVAFSPDGKVLASGSWDETVRLWDVNTGQLIQVLEGHTNTVESITFSPDGKVLASGSSDETVRLWDVHTGQLIRVLEGHTNEVNNVIFSPNSQLIASADEVGVVRLWQYNL